MPDKILLKRSLTSGSIPTTASLSVGELAVNVPDGKLFLRQSGSGTDTVRSLLTLDAPMSGNLLLTGSIVSTQGITGSLFGTSSWANNSISSSFATTASAATSITFTSFSNASYYFPQNLRVEGTLTAQQFNIEVISSSIIYESGSTKFGDSLDDTHQFTGSVQVNGSITGSLFGTSSWSFNSISSSFATTASAATSITFIPSTASYANNADLLDGLNSTVFATTGSNTFVGNQIISGSLTIVTGSGIELQVTNTGVTIGNSTADIHNITGSVRATGSLVVTTGSIAIGTTTSTRAFRILRSGSGAEISLSGGGNSEATEFYLAQGDAVTSYVWNRAVGSLLVGTSNTERIRITETGRVGINNTNPSAQLHVSASGTVNDLLIGDTTTPKLFVSGSGNVGIGTTTGTEKLRVVGTFASDAVWTTTAAVTNWGSYPTIYGTLTWNAGLARIHASAGNRLDLGANGSNAHITITGSGDVGIGITSSFSNKLHVQGNVSASSYTSSISNAVGFLGTASWAQNATSASAATSITFIPATASLALAVSGSGSRVLYNSANNVTTTSANLIFDGTNLTVGGQLNAATKSFLINHRTKPGKKLVYGVIEGPEHSVFVRGRLTGNNTIVLPNEWDWLVDLNSITVQLTAIGKPQKLFVKSIDRLYITVENGGFFSGPIDCYYLIQATRKDVEPLHTVV
jgi:hypothetical protein